LKKALLSIFIFIATLLSSFGQSPESFKYQAVARNAGVIITNQTLGFRVKILQGSPSGPSIYTEYFTPTTNAYGLVNLEVGTGATSDDFSAINWGNGSFFIETSIDFSGGFSYVLMGTSQLLSVPYALHSKTAENFMNDLVDDADADSTNEIQVVTFVDDTLYLSNGGQVYLGAYNIDLVDDADSDPNNEIELPTGGINGQVLKTDGSGNYSWTNQTVDTDSQLDSMAIANMGFVPEKTYTTGLYSELGGYVFWISADGKHGLVAETQDQLVGSSWYNAQNAISNPSNHSLDGQRYRDWRLPTIYELDEIYLQRVAIGNFNPVKYWSSTENDTPDAAVVDFSDGSHRTPLKYLSQSIRSVRDF